VDFPSGLAVPVIPAIARVKYPTGSAAGRTLIYRRHMASTFPGSEMRFNLMGVPFLSELSLITLEKPGRSPPSWYQP
jgi:hypothetical protein